MINLKSIDKRVQNTLLEKQRQLSEHNPIGGGNIFSRSVWSRVSCLFNGKLVSFFSDKDPTNINDSKSDTVYAFYRPDNSNQIYKRKVRTLTDAVSGETTPKYEESSAYYRPIPGVTSISTQYEGGLKSFRKTDLSFIVWTYDDIAFMQNSFMAIGNYVLLEYGWNGDINDTAGFSKPFLLEKLLGENPSITSPINLFNDVLQNYASYALEMEGNQDVIMGRVSNFEYTTRADGGFDCSVSLTSSGAQLLKTELPDIETIEFVSGDNQDANKFDLEAAKSVVTNVKTLMNSLPEQFDKFYVDVIAKYSNKKLLTNADGSQGFLSLIGDLVSLNIGMDDTSLSSLMADFSDNMSWHTLFHDEKYDGKGKSSEIEKVCVPQIYALHHTYNVRQTGNNSYGVGSLKLSEQDGTSDGLGMHYYVTLGWFEDNVLNGALGALNSKGNSIYKFRSTERFSPEFIKELGLAENPDGLYQDYLKITSGNHNMSEDCMPSVTISNNPFLTTMRPFVGKNFTSDSSKYCFILPGQNFVNSGDIKSGTMRYNGTVSQVRAMDAHLKYINEVFPSFAVQTGLENNKPTYDYSRGYYRNILVHIELLRDAVSNSKTVEDVYKNIFKNMNHDYGDFWDLSVVQDPIEQGKITVMDRNVTHLKIKQSQDSDTYYSDLYSTPNRLSTDDSPEPGEVYFFNIWEDNSIVKDYKVTSKIPDEFKVAMAYSGRDPDAHNLGQDKYSLLGRIINQQSQDYVEEKIGDINKEEFEGILTDLEQGMYTSEAINKFKSSGNIGILIPSNGKEIFLPVSYNPNSSEKTGINGGRGLMAITELLGKKIIIGDDSTTVIHNGKRGQRNDDLQAYISAAVISPKILVDIAIEKIKKYYKDKFQEVDDKEDKDEPVDASRPVIDIALIKDIGNQNGVLKLSDGDDALGEALTSAGFSDTDIQSYTDNTGDEGSTNEIQTKIYSHNIGGMNPILRGLYKSLLTSTSTSKFPNIPIEVEITIDGVSGIEPGDSFQVGYLQEEYLKYTLFQSIDVSHDVSNTGWYTTIKGIMRINRQAMGLFLPDTVKEVKPPTAFSGTTTSTPSETYTKPTGIPPVPKRKKTKIGDEPEIKPPAHLQEIEINTTAIDETSQVIIPKRRKEPDFKWFEDITGAKVLEDQEEDDDQIPLFGGVGSGVYPLGTVNVSNGMNYTLKKDGSKIPPRTQPKLKKIIPLKNQFYSTGTLSVDAGDEYTNKTPPPEAIGNIFLFEKFRRESNPSGLQSRVFRIQDELASNYPKYKSEWVVMKKVRGKVFPSGWGDSISSDMLSLNKMFYFKNRQVFRDYAKLHGYRLEEGSKISMNTEQVVR